MIGTRLAALLMALAALGLYLAPAYRANPNYVRSASTLAVLHELTGAGFVDEIRVETGGAPDLSTVTGQAAASKSSAASGLLTQEVTSYSFKLLTKSRCFELQSGCLEIQQKHVLKAVSVKVLL